MVAFQSFAEFAAFLMVHVARADGQWHHLEESVLHEKLGYFTSNGEQILTQMMALYPSIDKTKLPDFLRENFERLEPVSDQDRQELVRSLYAIVNADGRVHEEETQIMKLLREFPFLLKS